MRHGSMITPSPARQGKAALVVVGQLHGIDLLARSDQVPRTEHGEHPRRGQPRARQRQAEGCPCQVSDVRDRLPLRRGRTSREDTDAWALIADQRRAQKATTKVRGVRACFTLAVMSAMLLFWAKDRYMGALVADIATAARFLARLAAHASGRNAWGRAAAQGRDCS